MNHLGDSWLNERIAQKNCGGCKQLLFLFQVMGALIGGRIFKKEVALNP